LLKGANMVISFLNQKGGVGKTTVSFNVVCELASRGKKVLFVDSDLQGSASLLNEARESDLGFPIVSIANPSINKAVQQIKADYEYIVIDGIPSISKITQSTILASDVVVIPMQPSGVDVWATESLIEMVDAARVLNPDVVVGIVLNRFDGNRVLAKGILDMVEQTDWQVFDTAIGNRAVFQKSVTYGKSVAELERNGKADMEIKSLVDEILALE
jgi:chromosome partitioning protein